MSCHYVIRLNVQPCESQFMWRIWENNVELDPAGQVLINVPSYTEITVELEPDRFGRFERNNLACDGVGHWKDSVFEIDKE